MILGHSDPDVTREVYAHLMRKIVAEQVESASELLTRYRRTFGTSEPGEQHEGPAT